MTNEENWYRQLLLELEERLPPSNPSPAAEVRATRHIKSWYALSALGNALAQERGWPLVGMEAIDFAIISKYAWFLPQVRALPAASKWLALHEDLNRLAIDPLAIEVWSARYPSEAEVDLLDWTANPSGLPPVEDRGPLHE
ncbi:hypothetical protein [Halomonas elongata]|uniref:Uncharacterized protein n=1 Tax=Halomonas elongata (strain ATCC 33173 / DSM 2581 / NBRC 15536 / NCIMB 2198 / 1H9) TaxID=768066 RepID=A0A1R4A4H9_HALED|nr:hypothetical protein [Halomonas elongata]WBF17694.1 hypothetical protein LM502_16705 [Halomonas elongata]WPU46535.1 hypothetical protein SR933_14940 [Halomonas elongata DSM 2581]SJK83870.1 uncharacterized protein HELO_4067B [Halomonas elongata DSM 2581]